MSALYEHGTPHAEGYRDVDVGAVATGKNEARLVDVREPSEPRGHSRAHRGRGARAAAHGGGGLRVLAA
ncbi:hypothetical protein ACN28I_28455 [Archangium gephyra]|uniref:hypothetical protein n=1 Tax=Archangium gephyra TaxID=48 RepID=UPI003B801672